MSIALLLAAPVVLTQQSSSAAPLPMVTGRVVDLAGNPLAGVALGSGVGTFLTRTGADGTFRFTNNSEVPWLGIYAVVGSRRTGDSSTTRTTLTGFDVGDQGLNVGDVAIAVLDVPTRVRITDADGDPVPGAMWTGDSGLCVSSDRPDLPDALPSPGSVPTAAGESKCAFLVGYNPFDYVAPAKSNADGVMAFSMPSTYAAAIVAKAQIDLTDPATGDGYRERLSDAVYDPTTSTYNLTVPGIDAPTPQVPGPPRDVIPHLNPVTGRASIEWSPPVPEENTATVTGYTVTAEGDRGTVIRTVPDTDDSLRVSFGGIVRGETYTVSVVAHSDVGDSPASSPVSFQWVTNPSSPAAPSARVIKPGKVQVSWLPVDDDGGLPVTYTLTWNGKRFAAKPGQTSITLRGVRKGRYRTFVTATNSHGRTTGPAVTIRITR